MRGLPPRDKANWRIDRQGLTATLEPAVPGLEDLVLPLEPMIGCFGVAPAGGQAISTATSAENGGNMDYRGFGPGVTVWFPVSVPGALFFLGDGHAIQGDGEIVGTGIETCFEVEVRLTVEKAQQLAGRAARTPTDIFTVGNARPLDQALQHATTEMLRWLTGDYGSRRPPPATCWARSCATTSATSSTRPTRWSAGSRRSGCRSAELRLAHGDRAAHQAWPLPPAKNHWLYLP